MTQKALQLAIFLSFSFLSLFLDRLAKPFFKSVVAVDMHDQYLKSFIGQTGKPLCQINKKFCVWEHVMLCAFVINSNDGFKRWCVKFCPSTTKNISPLPPYLWRPSLGGWWIFNFFSFTSWYFFSW